jgi:hypothetical protein
MGDVANGDAVAIEPMDHTIQELDDLLVNSAAPPALEKTPRKEVIHSAIKTVSSNLKGWYNKQYLGGYRQKVSAIEYFNAETQTPTPQEIRNQNVFIIYFDILENSRKVSQRGADKVYRQSQNARH